MTRTLTLLALLAMIPAGMAQADDDCFVPMSRWQPRAALIALADQNAWTLRRIKIDDGCYQIVGTDAQGRRIEVTLNPETLAVLEFEYEDSDDEDNH